MSASVMWMAVPRESNRRPENIQPFFGSERLHDFFEPAVILEPEPNYEGAASDENAEIDQDRPPACHRVEFARAFLLIIVVEPAQGFVDFAADLAGVVLVAEQLGEYRRRDDEFRRRAT